MTRPSRAHQAIVTARFTKTLEIITAAGIRIHCSDPETRYLWLSDHAEDRARAVRLCRGCPILTPCREAASVRRETFGVWGAEDRTRPPGKTGRPTTHPVEVNADAEAAA